MSPFKGTPWRHTRRSLQLQDVFKGADNLTAVCAFASLLFIHIRIFGHSMGCVHLSWLLYSRTSFPQPGSKEPGLHVIMLDARYDRDPTYSFHGAIIFQSRLFCRHHLSYQTVAHTNNAFLTLTRRVPGILNAHVELHPVAVVGGGADQGGGHHRHRVRRPGDLRVVNCWPTTYPTKLIGKAQP